MRIIPKSVQIVSEDRPLLRIVEANGDVNDFEIAWQHLPLLAKQALASWTVFQTNPEI